MPSKITAGLSIINTIVLLGIMMIYFLRQNNLTYVDSARLVNGYVGMIEARKVYQSKAAVWQANIDTLGAEVQKEIMKYEKESASMTAKERELNKKLIQSKQLQLTQYQKSIQEKAGQEDAEATKKVMDEINAYIKEYGEEHNYRIILAATEYGNIAYAEEGLDLTEKILQGLNDKYSGK